MRVYAYIPVGEVTAVNGVSVLVDLYVYARVYTACEGMCMCE